MLNVNCGTIWRDAASITSVTYRARVRHAVRYGKHRAVCRRLRYRPWPGVGSTLKVWRA